MRRVLTILLVLIAVIGGSLAVYRVTAQEKQPPAPNYEVVTVNQGDIVSTVSATGAIQPQDEVSLIFKGAGRVGEVLVREGDSVTAGQLLARLETGDLDIALAQAENNLVISQAQLAKLKKGPTEDELSAARAAVASAEANLASARQAVGSSQSNYQDLVAGPSDDQKKVAEANLERARVALQQAQAAYDQVANLPNVGMMPQSVQLQQATIDYETAAANYRLAVAEPKTGQVASAGAQIAQARASVAQAEASLASAKSNLEKLQQGPSEEDLAIAEAQVRQSELALQQARLAKENAELRSPIDGVVTQLNVKVGELPAAARPAAVITDLSQFHIDINVDEIDIGKLKEGQKVVVTLDSLPDARLAAHVGQIAATPTQQGGVVSYKVTLVVDESDVPLRSGLSATASITTNELKDVLVAPNRAIRIDRTSGRTLVEKLVNGVPTQTEIRIGERNEQQSQVISGLQEGDQLAIRSGTGMEQLRSSMFGGQ